MLMLIKYINARHQSYYKKKQIIVDNNSIIETLSIIE